MKLRWFRYGFDDGFLYDLTPVNLSDDGKVVSWAADPIITLESMGNEPIFRDNLKDGDLWDALRQVNEYLGGFSKEEFIEAVRDAHMDYERNGCIDFELEMRMWGE